MVEMLLDVRPKFANYIGNRTGGQRDRAALNAGPNDAVVLGMPGSGNESAPQSSGNAPDCHRPASIIGVHDERLRESASNSSQDSCLPGRKVPGIFPPQRPHAKRDGVFHSALAHAGLEAIAIAIPPTPPFHGTISSLVDSGYRPGFQKSAGSIGPLQVKREFVSYR